MNGMFLYEDCFFNGIKSVDNATLLGLMKLTFISYLLTREFVCFAVSVFSMGLHIRYNHVFSHVL